MTVKHSKESAEDIQMMTVKLKSHEFAMNSDELQEFTDHNDEMMMRKSFSCPNQKIDQCFSEKLKRFMNIEEGYNQNETMMVTSSEGSSSSEDFEYSPKSVDGIGNQEHRNYRFVHHQVTKIREEDSHLGEDIGEGLNTKENNKLAVIQLSPQHVGALFWSRPILPSSPLSGKTAFKSFH